MDLSTFAFTLDIFWLQRLNLYVDKLYAAYMQSRLSPEKKIK